MDLTCLKPYARQVSDKIVKAPRKLPIRYLIAYQIILVTEGEAVLSIDEKDYTISKGDVAFIPPNVPYCYTVIKDFAQLHVYFDTNYSELSRVRNISYGNISSLPLERKKFLQENIYESYSLPYVFKPENFDQYIECWFEIKDAVKKNNSFVSEIKMLKMLNLLHTHYGLKSAKNSINYCEAVKDYLDANFLNTITLDDLARLHEMSKFTIVKKFKEAYGESPILYYNKRRLEFAKEALASSDKTIGEISRQLNFTDVYTFSKFFKIHTGISPKFYREENRA